jgi:glutamate-1-semialdehyde 2,1-aminomutase
VVTDSLPATAACPRCTHGKETFWYMNGLYAYDVDRARDLVGDGREAVELEDDSTRASVGEVELHEAHIGHVDPATPGIIAHIQYPTNDGEMVHGHVLIDGHHRAARCLLEQRSFLAYLLTEEESRAILLRSPDQATAGAGADDTRAYEVKFARSLPLFQRAERVIAGSTTHDRRGFGPFPVFVDRAEGPYKWDVGGHPLLDYWMGHGSLLFGHGFRPVVEAVTRQVTRGTHYGASHELEVRWAERVCALIPSAERVRFTASGTEATLLALRIARAFTGRPRAITLAHHFHGWHDEVLAPLFGNRPAGFNPGTLTQAAAASDLEGVVRLLERGDVAGVILEPGGAGTGALPWSPDFLRGLREATRAHGTLLIFDEVISGFRHTPGGVQQASGVMPDLTTLAKILAGGLPGGAVAGRADIMEVFGNGLLRGDHWVQVPHTGTFNANPLSAAAGIAMLEHVADGVPQEKARQAAERLVDLVNRAAAARRVDVHLYTNGTSIFHILIGAHAAGAPLGPSETFVTLHAAHRENYAQLRRALLVAGLDTHPLHGWVSAVHEPEIIETTAEVFDHAFRIVRHQPGFAL